MSFYLELSPAGGSFAAALRLKPSLPSCLSSCLPLSCGQTCRGRCPCRASVFGCLAPADEIPKGSLGALIPDKELEALSAPTQPWGLPEPAQQGCALFSCPVFPGKEQRSWVLHIIPHRRCREGELWARFPNGGDLAAAWVLWVPENFQSTSLSAPACISLFWQARTQHSHL